MKARNHTHIDILKVDIEDGEYDMISNWCDGTDTWPSFDMLLLEWHLGTGSQQEYIGDCMRERGYLLFFREENLHFCACGGTSMFYYEGCWGGIVFG